MADIPGSNTILYLPREYWTKQLAGYDTSVRSGVPDLIRPFIKEVEEGKSPHLIMTGTAGTGKSHLGVGLYRWGVLRFDTIASVWLHVPSFCDRVKKSYGTRDHDPYDLIRGCDRMLVLDDIFGRDLGEHELTQILNRVIEIAHQNQVALVATTNFSVAQIRAKLHPHEVSRLFQRASVAEFDGEDCRLTGRYNDL
jgi:DNA replication protein DnaC